MFRGFLGLEFWNFREMEMRIWKLFVLKCLLKEGDFIDYEFSEDS